MLHPFRDHHLLQLLHAFDQHNLPLDLLINHYFRANKALGSKDRAFIAEETYALVRWLALIDWYIEEPSWERRLQLWRQCNSNLLALQRQCGDIPKHIAVSFPQPLFEALCRSYGEALATKICLDSNMPAPTTVRCNTLKISRDALIRLWQSHYDITPCKHSLNGITFNKKMNFFTLPEFKQGFFEVQDEGSQIIAEMVAAKEGELVIDYCAGAGGKALAIAASMCNKGQIWLHDVRTKALLEAKKRLKRAGVMSAQTVKAEAPTLKKLKKKMDWVLVDAPCSGTGTLRRNPDMKWRFSLDDLMRLCGMQRLIFERALSYLKPNGHIVYATCSLLQEENQEQVDHFIKTYDLKLVAAPFHSIPTPGAMDGFYAAILTTR